MSPGATSTHAPSVDTENDSPTPWEMAGVRGKVVSEVKAGSSRFHGIRSSEAQL